MMFLAGVPFFFYKLTGKTKENIHQAVLEKRKEFDQNSDAKAEPESETESESEQG